MDALTRQLQVLWLYFSVATSLLCLFAAHLAANEPARAFRLIETVKHFFGRK